MACPQLMIWAAVTGTCTLSNYVAYLDGEQVYAGSDTQAEICIDDDASHILEVTAICAEGASEASMNTGTLAELAPPGASPTASPTSSPSMTPTVSPTLTPTVVPPETPTSTVTASPSASPTEEPSKLPPPVVCADFNADGIVGYPDFIIFSQNYGATHDGTWEPICE